MSTYTTLQDLKVLLGSNTDPPGTYERLTDRVGLTAGDDTVGQAILDQVEGKMNSYLGARYAIPVDVSGGGDLAAALRGYALDLAAHLTWINSPLSADESKDTKRPYDDAMKWLREVAAGKAVLPGDPPTASPGSGGAAAKRGGDDRLFKRDIY